MDREYKCEGYDMSYCCYSIMNNKWCWKCPQFETMWANRLKELEFAYCHIYETKRMMDCKGAKLDKEEGRYKCKHFDHWSKCPYKTPNKYYEGKEVVMNKIPPPKPEGLKMEIRREGSFEFALSYLVILIVFGLIITSLLK